MDHKNSNSKVKDSITTQYADPDDGPWHFNSATVGIFQTSPVANGAIFSLEDSSGTVVTQNISFKNDLTNGNQFIVEGDNYFVANTAGQFLDPNAPIAEIQLNQSAYNSGELITTFTLKPVEAPPSHQPDLNSYTISINGDVEDM